jgi:RNA polymerase sigma-70 factor (ECF subfamily)
MIGSFGEVTACVDFDAMPRLNPLRKSGAGTTCENSEYDLVREATQGNQAAFAELVRHHDRAILRLTLHLTGSPQDAQDLCQETFLKAYRNLSSFRFESSFGTWLHRIAANSCLGFLRKQRSRKASLAVSAEVAGGESDLLDRIPDDHPLSSPEQALMNGELRKQIADALQSLTPRERMLFELRHYHGLKIRAAAEMLNTSEESAKTTLFRATRKLRKQLAIWRASQGTSDRSGGRISPKHARSQGNPRETQPRQSDNISDYFSGSCRLFSPVSDIPSREQ